MLSLSSTNFKYLLTSEEVILLWWLLFWLGFFVSSLVGWVWRGNFVASEIILLKYLPASLLIKPNHLFFFHWGCWFLTAHSHSLLQPPTWAFEIWEHVCPGNVRPFWSISTVTHTRIPEAIQKFLAPSGRYNVRYRQLRNENSMHRRKANNVKQLSIWTKIKRYT